MPSLAIFRELVEPEYQFLRRVLNKDSIFFDVGGGIGTYSLFVAKMVNGPIHTFEPVEENIQTIKINLRVNHVESKVHLNSVALSNQEGFGRIKKDADTTLFSSEITDVSRESFADSINVTTLDSYCAVNKIDHIDLIKIDVEGHEEEVIKGSKNMLKEKNITTIILEADHRLAKFYDSLKDIGFEVFYYDYRNNSIRRIFPICEEAIQNLEPTAFNSNIILIQKKMLDTYAEKFNLLF
jgi:FkbM family methyltransferase